MPRFKKNRGPKFAIGSARASKYLKNRNKKIIFPKKWLSTGCLEPYLDKSKSGTICNAKDYPAGQEKTQVQLP